MGRGFSLTLVSSLGLAACSFEPAHLARVGRPGDEIAPGDGPVVSRSDTDCEVAGLFTCVDGDFYLQDGCTGVRALRERCFDYGCNPTGCLLPAWFGLGDSALTEWGTRVWWGSTQGGGITGSTGGVGRPDIAVDAAGRPVVAWPQRWDDATSAVYVLRLEASGEWVELGGSGSGEGISGRSLVDEVHIAIAPGDQPVVVYEAPSSLGYTQIFARRWDGGTWNDLGSTEDEGITGGTGWSINPALVVTPSGSIVVAMVEDRGRETNDIYVRRFDSGTWVAVGYDDGVAGGVSDNATASGSPALAAVSASPRDHLWLAWADGGSNANVFVMRFDGTVWEEVPAGSASGGGISGTTTAASTRPSIAIGAGGKPIVSWQEGLTGASNIHVRGFGGTGWDEAGGSGSGGGISDTSDPSVDPDLVVFEGEPLVIWYEAAATESLAGLHWNELDSAWNLLGTQSSPIFTAGWIQSRNPAAAVGAGKTWVIWWADDQILHGPQLFVMTWDGLAWDAASDPNASTSWLRQSDRPSGSPAIAFDPLGAPVVAWSQDTATVSQIYVARFDGTVWGELGSGSSSGGGISQSTDGCLLPAIAIDAQGRVTVVWVSRGSAASQIFGRRFDGLDWVSLAGSGTGDGISATSTISNSPRVAIAADEAPFVVWADGGGATWEVLGRIFDGTRWVGIEGTEGSGLVSELTASVQAKPDVVVLADGSVVVGYATVTASTGFIDVVRQNGTTWAREVVSPVAQGVDSPVRLTVDSQARVTAAWLELANARRTIRLKRRDTGGWVEIAGSATGDGIGGATVDVVDVVDVTTTRGDDPVVVWAQHAAVGRRTTEIYALRHLGGSWVELTTGAASGGGISDSSVPSMRPAVASSVEYTCVVWQEPMPDTPGLALRCTKRP